MSHEGIVHGETRTGERNRSSGSEGSGAPLIDVVIVSFNEREHTLACCGSVFANVERPRVIVVDNASDDGSADAVSEAYPSAEVLLMPSNQGFAAAVNRGTAAGSAPFVLLLNNDARLEGEAVGNMLEAMTDAHVAAAGPRLVGSQGQVEISIGRTLSLCSEAGFKVLEALYRNGRGPLAGLVERYYEKPHATRSLSAACVLFRREALEQIGGFDQRFFMYAEDVDVCRRLVLAGWRLRYVPAAVVEHERGVSGRRDPMRIALAYRRSQMAFYRKHHGRLRSAILRAYLVLRYALASIAARGERRDLARTMLRWSMRDAGGLG